MLGFWCSGKENGRRGKTRESCCVFHCLVEDRKWRRKKNLVRIKGLFGLIYFLAYAK
jgi:hypothetical protein